MLIDSEILDEIRNAVESIEFGKVVININSAGKYVEITKEERKRVNKGEDVDRVVGRKTAFRTDTDYS